MTLAQARARYKVQGIDETKLADQEGAFQNCIQFLSGIQATKAINPNAGSYNLKHVVENPTRSFGRPSDPSKYTGYVYEGTFILAALASGFKLRYRGPRSMGCTFNLSTRSLKNKVLRM